MIKWRFYNIWLQVFGGLFDIVILMHRYEKDSVCSQIFELCRIFKGFISWRYIVQGRHNCMNSVNLILRKINLRTCVYIVLHMFHLHFLLLKLIYAFYQKTGNCHMEDCINRRQKWRLDIKWNHNKKLFFCVKSGSSNSSSRNNIRRHMWWVTI